MRSDLSSDEARRIALAAQGFTDPRPAGRVDARHLRRVLERIGLVQLDSVNAVVRSHYLPFFSRLGAYPMEAVDDLAYRRRELFEYWGHAASLIPVAHEPLLRHRMAGWPMHGAIARVLRERPDYLDRVRHEVSARGPLQVSDLEDPGQRGSSWWGWGPGKIALEWLFGRGEIGTATRRHFTRLYDVRDRVIPDAVRARPTPEVDEAQRALLLVAARSHGVGTARDLADYHRLPLRAARPLLEDLADAGALERVRVDGWREGGYAAPRATVPRRVEARALLTPFDSLVWERARTERLFDFRYRIEIYTPAAQRRYGYYVLPFLLGERIVARVDARADRERGALHVPAAFAEPGAGAAEVADALAAELRLMAAWLSLERVTVGRRGDLASPLRRALGA